MILIFLDIKGNFQTILWKWTIKNVNTFCKILVLTLSLDIENLQQQFTWEEFDRGKFTL